MDYIEIEGYKSIKKARIELKPINILIGANGAGKSNILSFFEFLNWLYERRLKEYVALNGGVEKMLHKGLVNSIELYSKVAFGNNAYSFRLKKGEEHFVFMNEGLWYGSNPYVNNPIEITDYSTEAKLKFNDKPRAKYTRDYLENLKKYHFHDTGKNSPFNQQSHIQSDAYVLYHDGSNLAALLYRINEEKPKVYRRIVKSIQRIAPYFSDFYLKPNENGFIRLTWQDKYSSFHYGVNDLSDGTIRFIALSVLFMQPKLPDTIIIDEPELGLHPWAIAILSGMITGASNDNCQIILATQSIDLLNYFSPEDIITVDQIEGESIFTRLNKDNLNLWLEDYSIGDLWKRNIINSGQPA
ncbi:ATPase-like protein [Flavobacterium psychrophilum]|uniref:AAA family ATPase n=1 Tax=Flavobacterium psychrophilum TaxID=96345 RepID=UPI000B7C558F|nr:AAA family ATPase [Flavobacterium psychrophilum]SNB28241.1 ATPase-like protein [Flavobacterium psychrophilum]